MSDGNQCTMQDLAGSLASTIRAAPERFQQQAIISNEIDWPWAAG